MVAYAVWVVATLAVLEAQEEPEVLEEVEDFEGWRILRSQRILSSLCDGQGQRTLVIGHCFSIMNIVSLA